MRYKLGDVALVRGGKRLPKGSILQSKGNGHPYIRISDYIGDTFDINRIQYVPDNSLEILKKYRVNSGDIFLSIVGTIGIVCEIPDNLDGANLTENAVKIVADADVVSGKYLAYFLKSKTGQAQIQKFTVGTTQRKLPIKNIKNIELDLPPLFIQNKVVRELSIIDQKIALNKRINDNLLELTQSVYQELNSNRTTDGTLSNICQLVTKKIDTAELNNNNFWSTSNLLSNKRGATQAKEMPKSTKCTEVYRFDTLFGNIRPYFKKVYLASRNGGCSPDVLAFRAISQNLQAYLFSVIASDKFINQAVAGSKGTKMPRGDKEQMMETPIYTPTEQELSAFNKAVIPSLVAIQENTTENEYLTLIKQQLLLKYF